MTQKKPVQTKQLDLYGGLTIGQLEEKIEQEKLRVAKTGSSTELRIMRVALQERLKRVKGKVMNFEEGNTHHLLLFDSTNGFRKMAGHSVLFYSLKIVERIGRRCRVMPDNDRYSRSEDGIISFKSYNTLDEKLAMLDIVPDDELSTEELHFYKLPRVYTEEQIEKLRDIAQQDLEQIQTTIIPQSPLPDLYRAILELNQIVYHKTKQIADSYAREIFGRKLVEDADLTLRSYLGLANVRPQGLRVRAEVQRSLAAANAVAPITTDKVAGQNLMNLLLSVAQMKARMLNIENLRLLHHKQSGQILAKLVQIEKMAEREYNRVLRDQYIQRS